MAFDLPPGVARGSDLSIYLALEALVSGGGTIVVRPTSYENLGYQQISNATLAASTSLTVPADATIAVIQNNGTQPCRYRDDGTDPTSSSGQRIPAGETLTYDGDLAEIELIREADGVTLDIHYYRAAGV